MKLSNSMKTAIGKGPIGIYLMAFVIPLYQKLLGIAVLIIVLEFLIRNVIIKREVKKPNLTWKNPNLWLFLFYMLHIVGLIHTENKSFANLDLGMKSTLAIFPLLFFFYQPKVNWKLFVKIFIAGALFSILINFTISLNLYLEDHQLSHFYDSRFTHLMHRGYWAVYLCIATFFILKLGINTSLNNNKVILFLLAFIIVAAVLLSLSKMGLILLGFLTLWSLVKVHQSFQNKWVLPICVVLFVCGTYSIYRFTPVVKHRIDAMITTMGKPISAYDMEKPGSTGARVLVWSSSIELIKENFWFGVGTGDIKDELIQRNFDNGYVYVAEKQLNSHNQFLNSHIALGVLAPLFLLMIFISNCVRRSTEDYFYLWRVGIVCMLFLAMLTESMLEVEAGIIPYAFLLTFLTSFKAIRNSIQE